MSSPRTDRHHKTSLHNGIRVIGERIPDCNSVIIGVFVFCGARDEPEGETGIAHFTEHMMFKGTTSRTCQEIARVVDGVGGVLNAYTNKEYTCYYLRVVKDKLQLAMQIVSDMFLNSVYPADEVEKEKQVVIQEIGMVNDTPDDHIHDLVLESLYGQDSLGHSILGSESHVNGFDRDKIADYVSRYYRNDRIVVGCAGNFTWNSFRRLAEQYFGNRPASSFDFPVRSSQAAGSDMRLSKDHLYQVHTGIGFRTSSMYDRNKYPLKLLSNILGGGMSSMLFQELREKTGYAYSVFSFNHSYQDTGYFEIYFGTTTEYHEACMDKVREILKNAAAGVITASDLESAKEQLKGYILLSQDSVDARFTYNAISELYYNDYRPVEDDLSSIFSVTLDEIVAAAGAFLSFDKARIALISPDEKTQTSR